VGKDRQFRTGVMVWALVPGHISRLYQKRVGGER
jgi:hypothetical protein